MSLKAFQEYVLVKHPYFGAISEKKFTFTPKMLSLELLEVSEIMLDYWWLEFSTWECVELFFG